MKDDSRLLTYARKLAKLGQDEILKELGIKYYKKFILKMPNEELLKEFGKSAKNINKSLFIKNVIWQTYEQIKAGQKPFQNSPVSPRATVRLRQSPAADA